MSRCLKGLDVVIGAAPATMYTPGHGMNMGPGGKNLTQFYGPDMWQQENFWRGWGGDTEIDDLNLIGDELLGFDLATWQQQGAMTRNWETQTERPWLVGAFDISTWQKEMNVLKNVPLVLAQVLVARGQKAINAAQALAKAYDLAQAQIPFSSPTPRAANRENVAGKLQWHADNLARLAPTAWGLYSAWQNGDKAALKKMGETLAASYPNADDLKKWCMEAFIEYNAVEGGAVQAGENWKTLWKEMAEAAAALPALIASGVGNVAQNVSWYLKWTYWAAIGGGILALALLALGTGLGIKGHLAARSTTK